MSIVYLHLITNEMTWTYITCLFSTTHFNGENENLILEILVLRKLKKYMLDREEMAKWSTLGAIGSKKKENDKNIHILTTISSCEKYTINIQLVLEFLF